MAGLDEGSDHRTSSFPITAWRTGKPASRPSRSCARRSARPIPAFLISGDTAPERLREARESGHHLLHKPVRPMPLRAMVSQLLQDFDIAGAA